MKKYIFFDGTLGNGGAERVISILSKSLIDEGMEVEIVLFYDEPIFYDIDSKVKITVIPKEIKSNNIFRKIIWLRKYFTKNASVIISFLSPFNMVAIVAKLGLNIPIIVAERTDASVDNFLYRSLRDFLYSFTDAIVVQSKKNQDYFSKRLKNRIEVIYNPIDINETLRYSRSSRNNKLIISVGRLLPVKNQIMLIEAFVRIHYIFSDYKLVIYGDGPLREELKQYISDVGLTEYILLPGATKNIFEKMKEADVFVLTSNYEGMPNALLEAMCLGIPCVSTKVSGAVDVIEDGINGYLVDVGDVETLYNTLIYLIENEAKRLSISKNAMDVYNYLNVSIITEKWLDLINNVLRSE